MNRANLDHKEVARYFDEAAEIRPLLPDASSVAGWGKRLKYQTSAEFVGRSGVVSVLDLGCNIGHMAHFIARQTNNGSRQPICVTGVDISLASLKQARRLSPDNGRFSAADGRHLPFPDNRFELVLCLDVLEHTADQETLLKEVRRVLMPGGQLFLMTPNPRCLGSYWSFQLYRFLRAAAGRPEADKDSFVNRQELQQLLESAGFQTEAIWLKFFLSRPFIILKGWVITPLLPPRIGLVYQKLFNRLFGKYCQNLPVFLRERIGHSLLAVVRQD